MAELDRLSCKRGEPGFDDWVRSGYRLIPHINGHKLYGCVRLSISEGWADVWSEIEITNKSSPKFGGEITRFYGNISVTMERRKNYASERYSNWGRSL